MSLVQLCKCLKYNFFWTRILLQILSAKPAIMTDNEIFKSMDGPVLMLLIRKVQSFYKLIANISRVI